MTSRVLCDLLIFIRPCIGVPKQRTLNVPFSVPWSKTFFPAFHCVTSFMNGPIKKKITLKATVTNTLVTNNSWKWKKKILLLSVNTIIYHSKCSQQLNVKNDSILHWGLVIGPNCCFVYNLLSDRFFALVERLNPAQ